MKILNNLPPIFAPGAEEDQRIFESGRHFSHNYFSFSLTMIPMFHSQPFLYSLNIISLFLS